jgi:hypothetical protein
MTPFTKDPSVNPDVSVAPEIAQLMERPRPAGSQPAGTQPAGTQPTVGDLARELKAITGTPDLWWSLVRFDAAHPVRVPIPTAGAYQAWLSILPPAAVDHGASDVLTVVAGELTEQATGQPPGAPGTVKRLLPGQVRVHGAPGPHQAVNTSDGYTVSVHLRAHSVPPRQGQ